MKDKRPTTESTDTTDSNGGEIMLRTIRNFARRVAQRFRPEKIILFGSYAYGSPNADSDVDLLVIMPARTQLDQAAKIRLDIPAPFAMDLIVRTPKKMKTRLERGDSFTKEIVSKGKVLYEDKHQRMGAEGGKDRVAARRCSRGKTPLHDSVCFHCQQCAEKHLKGLLEELGHTVPKTHDLIRVHNLLLPHHPQLRPLKRGLGFLTTFVVAAAAVLAEFLRSAIY